VHEQEYRLGEPQAPLKRWRHETKRGTDGALQAEPEIFTNIVEFHYDILAKRLRELSFLNSGVRIELIDERETSATSSSTRAACRSFVQHLNQRDPDAPLVFWFRTNRTAIGVECRDAVERLLPGNDVLLHQQHPAEGRRHAPAGFRAALTRTLNDYIEKEGVAKKAREGADHRRRHARRPDRDPLGEGAGSEVLLADQGQAGLVRSEGRGRTAVAQKLEEFLLEHPPKRRRSPARSSMPRAPAKPRARRAR
jgi:DNA gyrase subunit B